MNRVAKLGSQSGSVQYEPARPASLCNPNRAIPVTHLFGDMESRVPAEEVWQSELGTEGVGKPALPPRVGEVMGAIVVTMGVNSKAHKRGFRNIVKKYGLKRFRRFDELRKNKYII